MKYIFFFIFIVDTITDVPDSPPPLPAFTKSPAHVTSGHQSAIHFEVRKLCSSREKLKLETCLVDMPPEVACYTIEQQEICKAEYKVRVRGSQGLEFLAVCYVVSVIR